MPGAHIGSGARGAPASASWDLAVQGFCMHAMSRANWQTTVDRGKRLHMDSIFVNITFMLLFAFGPYCVMTLGAAFLG